MGCNYSSNSLQLGGGGDNSKFEIAKKKKIVVAVINF